MDGMEGLTLHQAEKKFRNGFVLRAVVEAGGNVCRAALLIGIHRNTASRILQEAGVTKASIREIVKMKRRRPEAQV